MKAVMIMFDSLNRHFLPGYAEDAIDLPNFRRLAEQTVSFDASYAGSLPCMPARRELHTGRYNFLHRSWGPLEPFDDSCPEILGQHGVYTHLSTDHYHYFEDGGATYHNRYSTYSCHRGQESDCWVGLVNPPDPIQMMSLENLPAGFRELRLKTGRQNMANRNRMTRCEDFPQHKTFADGIEFIENNRDQDNWFVSIETFDPHEPFQAPDDVSKRFFDPDHPYPPEDWIPYAKVTEDKARVDNMRQKYKALLTYCDQNLGKVLDVLDQYDLWEDTLLIVNTDHGILLSEHEWWGKSVMPVYEEIAHTPLYIWDPRCRKKDERRQSLVQTIDLAPTLLDYFGCDIPADMQGKPLNEVIDKDIPVRDDALFGFFGDTINITDGRYVLMRAPVSPDAALHEYTLMPTHMSSRFSPDELADSTLDNSMPFFKHCQVLKIPSRGGYQARLAFDRGDLLFDLKNDPGQMEPLNNEAVKRRLLDKMADLMKQSDAPAEQFARFGLDGSRDFITIDRTGD